MFYKFFLLFFIKFSYGFFYITQLNELHSAANETLIRQFRINWPQLDHTGFPPIFSLNFSELSANFDIEFVRQDVPRSDDIYVIDPVSKQPVKHSHSNSIEEYEFYEQKNSEGFATLIRNRFNSTNMFRMFGTVFSAGGQYAFEIAPIVDKRSKRGHFYDAKKNFHKITRRYIADHLSQIELLHPEEDLVDYIILKDTHPEEKKKFFSRDKRAVNGGPIELNLELLVVTDSSVFNTHRNFIGSSNTDVVFLHMRHYFAHLIHGVNMRYKNSLSQDHDLRLNIILANFLFLTDALEQQWLDPKFVGEPANPSFNGRDVVLTTKTYNAFVDYMNRKYFPFEYDHAIALFNKDLWSSDTTQTRSMTVGFASIGTICTQNRYSLSEEIGGFINILVVAHEIAHGLGAFHDGIIGLTESCPVNSRDVMSPSLGGSSSHRFSSCSIDMFKSTLLSKNLDSVASNAVCLTNKAVLNQESSQIRETDAGRIYSPDDICRMIYGPTATYCQNKIESICRSLNCRVNSTSSFCSPIYAGAPDGTPCASGRVCISGECTPSTNAKIGTCIFKEDVITQEVEREIQLPFPQISCDRYFNLLEMNGKSIASYCAKTDINNICCQKCKKYNALNCQDKYSNCPSDNGCNDRINVNGEIKFIYQVCPRTCNRCQRLSCADGANLCENGATCTDIFSSFDSLIGFRCECPPGFTGEYCESSIMSDPCDSNPCLNGGTCFSFTQNFYTCLCQNSCSGLNCADCLFNQMTTNRPFQIMQSSTQTIKQNCQDQIQFCSIFLNYCNDLAFFDKKTIREVCPKTCNSCPTVVPCFDAQSNCANFKFLCQYFDVNYFAGNWITHPCYKTCGHC